MLYLAGALLCSVLVTIILKFAQMRNARPLPFSLSNYIIAGLLACVQPLTSGASFRSDSLIVALIAATGFVAGTFTFMRAIAKMGLAVPASIARVSLLLPVIASVLVFHDPMAETSFIGVGVGIVAFVVLGVAQHRQAKRNSEAFDASSVWLLVGVFVITGAIDFSMKVAERVGAADGWYLPCVFGAAAVYSGVLVVRKRQWIRSHEFSFGVLLAIPNYVGCLCGIRALSQLSGVVVFPVVGAGTVVLATFASILIWKESLNRLAWVGVALAVLTVVLLTQ